MFDKRLACHSVSWGATKTWNVDGELTVDF